MSAPVPLLERLAELEHIQWIEWSRNLVENEHAITSARRERWRKLWVPYSELTEEQKDRDRKWAQKVLDIVEGQKNLDLLRRQDPSILGAEGY